MLMESTQERYLSTAQVADRLGVKPETVYAYASRGLLTSVKRPGERGSRFAEREVSALAERTRGTRPPAGAVERIETELTLLRDDRLYFRGRDAIELATTQPFEAVARWLWHSELDGTPFTAPTEMIAVTRSVVAAMPPDARLTDLLRAITSVAAATDADRFDLAPAQVIAAGSRLLAVFGEALPGAGSGKRLAESLWPAFTGRPATEENTAVLDVALGLLADHDLAASTVAARVAASARAHPYAVVSTGLGTIDGRFHGGVGRLVHAFLAEALPDPAGAVARSLAADIAPPGFGHRFYATRDPRAEALFAALPAGPVTEAVDVLVAEVNRQVGRFPTIDVALGAMVHAFEMRPDTAEAVFAIARSAGWLAHALEEYLEPGLRFRPAGVYVGPAV